MFKADPKAEIIFNANLFKPPKKITSPQRSPYIGYFRINDTILFLYWTKDEEKANFNRNSKNVFSD